MAVVGVVIKAGFSFAIIVMLLVALITGLVQGLLRPTQILQALHIPGCGQAGVDVPAVAAPCNPIL